MAKRKGGKSKRKRLKGKEKGRNGKEKRENGKVKGKINANREEWGMIGVKKSTSRKRVA
jgi:hypothetical protein